MSGYAGGTAEADIVRLRRMVAEPGTATYTDSALVATISRYPLPDVAGEWPLLTSGSVNTDWVGTFDLAHAAADVWDEKATNFVGHFDFTADGATFHKVQVTQNYERQARKWRSRRSMGSHTMVPYPASILQDVWIGNLAEQD